MSPTLTDRPYMNCTLLHSYLLTAVSCIAVVNHPPQLSSKDVDVP